MSSASATEPIIANTATIIVRICIFPFFLIVTRTPPAFKISTHLRRRTNNPEPRFQRERGGESMIEAEIRAVEIKRMPTTDKNKPTGKAGRRNRKAEQRSQESD